MNLTMPHIKSLIVLLLVPVFSGGFEYQEKVAVVISSEVALNEVISQRDILDIYTLRKKSWDSGLNIKIADYKGNSEIRQHFYNFLNVSIRDIRRLWLKEQFTGRSIPPQVVDNEEQMIKMIREDPGTIGYLPINGVPTDFTILILIDD